MTALEGSAQASIVVLDACRNNPLAEALQRRLAGRGRGAAVSRGLGRIEASAGNTLVVYSAGPGQEAQDGAGRNSPFTAAFLKHGETPGLEVEQMLKRVTAEVEAATGGKQQPERLSRLKIELWLMGEAPAAAIGEGRPQLTGVAHNSPEDAQAWALDQYSDSESTIQTFISLFPGSIFVGEAKARLEWLRNHKPSNDVDLQPQSTGCQASHGDYVVINVKWGDPDGGLVISDGPGMKAKRLGVIPSNGNGIGIFGCQGIWCRVKYGCFDGWSSKLYLAERTERTHRVTGVQSSDPDGLNVRSGPGSNYSRNGSIPFNATDVAKHTCQSSPVDGSEWCLVSRYNLSGWVAGRYLAR